MDEKITELIAWLKADHRWSYIDRNDVLATLAEQVQEIERLTDELKAKEIKLNLASTAVSNWRNKAEAAEARRQEPHITNNQDGWMSRALKLDAELAAIEAATIERCVQIWERYAGRMSVGQITVECRALKRTQDTNRP